MDRIFQKGDGPIVAVRQAEIAGQRTAKSMFESIRFDRAADGCSGEIIEAEPRDLDAVESACLDFRKQIKMCGIEGRRPQQSVDTVFHQFRTVVCAAVMATGRVSLPILTE